MRMQPQLETLGFWYEKNKYHASLDEYLLKLETPIGSICISVMPIDEDCQKWSISLYNGHNEVSLMPYLVSERMLVGEVKRIVSFFKKFNE